MESKDIKTMTYAEYKKQTNYQPRIAEIVDLEGLRQINRKHYLVHQRYYLMWFLRQNTKMSLTAIGQMFNRDHSTVIHAIKQHNDLVDVDDDMYKSNIANVKTFLELKY